MKKRRSLSSFEKDSKRPESSQRELAKELGFSLGKLNYCLKALQKKGLVKLTNFQKKKDKIKYLQYVVTPKGIAYRTKLTIDFMKRKMREYDELQKELKNNFKKKLRTKIMWIVAKYNSKELEVFKKRVI